MTAEDFEDPDAKFSMILGLALIKRIRCFETWMRKEKERKIINIISYIIRQVTLGLWSSETKQEYRI